MLGILIGCALRTSVYLKLKFPQAIWKLLTGESLNILDFKEFDIAFYTKMSYLSHLQTAEQYNNAGLELTFTFEEEEMVQNGAKRLVCFENLDYFRSLSMKHYIKSLNQPLKLLKRGISKIIPADLLDLLTADELKLLICGPVKVDIEVLKKNTVYISETLKETDELVVNFWKVVE